MTKQEFEKELDIGTTTKTYTRAHTGKYYRLDTRNGCPGAWTYHNGARQAVFVTQSLGVQFGSLEQARAWIIADVFGV